MSILLELAERCEREEPSFALDCELGAAMHNILAPGICIHQDGVWTINRNGTPLTPRWERYIPLPYTTSLDAAVTLVPEGAEWEMTNLYGVAYAEVGLNFSEGPPGPSRRNDGNLVMTFCAAALRARDALLPARVRPRSERSERATPSS